MNILQIHCIVMMKTWMFHKKINLNTFFSHKTSLKRNFANLMSLDARWFSQRLLGNF